MGLEEIWRKIPSMECEEGCTECCFWPSRTPLEEERVREWLEERGRKEKWGGLGGGRWGGQPPPGGGGGAERCPYAEGGRCSLWPVRFLPCRLFGVVETVRCPKGRGPERFLTEEEAVVLVLELDRENELFLRGRAGRRNEGPL
jgi:hypothetical protein